MAGYDQIIGRSDAGGLIPEQEVSEIIQMAPAESLMLSRARQVRMSTKKAKQSVLSTLPDAYWVNAESDDVTPANSLKQTSKAAWQGLTITAEELAVIVPIPDAVVDDASVPLWPQVRPLLREAVGAKVDAAAIFGSDKPTSWPNAIVPGAINAGNTAMIGDQSTINPDVASMNLADAFAEAAALASSTGFAVNGFATQPGLNWRLRMLKDSHGDNIFSIDGAGTPNLYGYTADEVRNGAWNPAEAVGIAVDWSKVIIGVRQDITYQLFSEGVISDNNGAVVLNLMQQDTKALRVVFRVGFQVALPKSRLGAGYPAGVVLPDDWSGSSSSS